MMIRPRDASLELCNLSEEKCLWMIHAQLWRKITVSRPEIDKLMVGRANYNCWKINNILIGPRKTFGP